MYLLVLLINSNNIYDLKSIISYSFYFVKNEYKLKKAQLALSLEIQLVYE